MSYRFMRIMVFFDLPVVDYLDRREATAFRKFLMKNGFIMMQESVYSKLVLNTTAAEAVMGQVRAHCPDKGLVQMLMVTEKQYNGIEMVIGNKVQEVINNAERLVEL